ncbi:siderophore-interacting protein [Nocardioides sp. R-C-SC26]|uniref:siderophore-interacting protein n=1 Tax=Nocardioides sp. R-C-SC26 TaxID=2870414 RepID=UPI001E54CED4|nr:siderophore-interacting protein [Nocardioides sp. R-C-SC26]
MHGEVEDVAWIAPRMVRIVLGGTGLRGFAVNGDTDSYINVAIPPAEAPYGPVFDVDEVRATLPAEFWPARRRYTVRAWDEAAGLLTVDVVTHGDDGAAGPWAASARPGDVLVFSGPSGGYRPAADAAWHLMAGDESALPAIAASLEVLAPTARAVVRVVCDGPEHEIELVSPAEVDLLWLHRDASPDVDQLAASIRALPWSPGPVHAFVHGEADEIRGVRKHLLTDRGLTRADMSCSPYWRRTMTDEAWRQVKRDFVRAMEDDTP